MCTKCAQIPGMQDEIEQFRKLSINLFRYSGMYRFTTPCLVLRDPELIKQITVKDFDYFTDHHSFIPKNVDPILESILFQMKGT